MIRSFYKFFALTFVLLFFSKPVAGLNVIFVLADDAGYGDFGPYGQVDIQTPNIDSLAEQGIVFSRHYSAAPVSAPARASLLTGYHTGHSEIRGNIEQIPEGQLALSDESFTVGHMLQENGITTAIIGKWGLGGPGSTGEPNDQGFDYWFGYLCQREAHSYYPDHLWENGEKIFLDGETYSHDLFTEKALSFIRDNAEDDFFLYLPYAIPHADLEIPDRGIYKNGVDGRDLPDKALDFAAMITKLDTDIGKIVRLVNELGIAEETLIIVSSDNGPHSEGGADPAFFNSSAGLRGQKRDLYEGGIRVPFIAYWPGTIESSRSTNLISTFYDFMPTLAELYNIPLDESLQLDGISYLPELLGETERQEEHDFLYWEFHEQGGKQAVLQDNWKAVRLEVRLFPNRVPELYNLASDPFETVNLADEYPEKAVELSELMASARTVNDNFPLIGKDPFSFQLFNTWLYFLPFVIVVPIFIISARKSNRKNLIKILFDLLGKPQNQEKIHYTTMLSTLGRVSLLFMLPFMHLRFGLFDTIGMLIAILGLIGVTVILAMYSFSRKTLLKSDRRYELLLTFFLIYLFGLGFAALNRAFILVWLLVVVSLLLEKRKKTALV